MFAFGDEARNLGRLDLDPGHVTVMADADLGEADCFQGRLCGFDLAERGDGDLGSMWDARRISALPMPASSRGNRTPRRTADPCPGR
jgi:hypothetical protein